MLFWSLTVAVSTFLMQNVASNPILTTTTPQNFADDMFLDYNFTTVKGRSMGQYGGLLELEYKYAKYLVSIRTRHPMKYFGDNHFCTGTVVGSRLVLTAAHCVVDSTKSVIRARRLIVVAATPNRLRRDKTTVELGVEEVIPHEKFRRHGVHDIAILRLQEPIPRDNDAIKILKMATKPIEMNAACITIGWCPFFTNGPFSANPWYMKIRIVEGYACRRFFPFDYKSEMICGDNTEDVDSDACRVDLGGAMICNDFLTGIVSWGQRCRAGTPVVFSNVFLHRKWIDITNSVPPRQLAVGMAVLISAAVSAVGLLWEITLWP